MSSEDQLAHRFAHHFAPQLFAHSFLYPPPVPPNNTHPSLYSTASRDLESGPTSSYAGGGGGATHDLSASPSTFLSPLPSSAGVKGKPLEFRLALEEGFELLLPLLAPQKQQRPLPLPRVLRQAAECIADHGLTLYRRMRVSVGHGCSRRGLTRSRRAAAAAASSTGELGSLHVELLQSGDVQRDIWCAVLLSTMQALPGYWRWLQNRWELVPGGKIRAYCLPTFALSLVGYSKEEKVNGGAQGDVSIAVPLQELQKAYRAVQSSLAPPPSLPVMAATRRKVKRKRPTNGAPSDSTTATSSPNAAETVLDLEQLLQGPFGRLLSTAAVFAQLTPAERRRVPALCTPSLEDIRQLVALHHQQLRMAAAGGGGGATASSADGSFFSIENNAHESREDRLRRTRLLASRLLEAQTVTARVETSALEEVKASKGHSIPPPATAAAASEASYLSLFLSSESTTTGEKRKQVKEEGEGLGDLTASWAGALAAYAGSPCSLVKQVLQTAEHREAQDRLALLLHPGRYFMEYIEYLVSAGGGKEDGRKEKTMQKKRLRADEPYTPAAIQPISPDWHTALVHRRWFDPRWSAFVSSAAWGRLPLIDPHTRRSLTHTPMTALMMDGGLVPLPSSVVSSQFFLRRLLVCSLWLVLYAEVFLPLCTTSSSGSAEWLAWFSQVFTPERMGGCARVVQQAHRLNRLSCPVCDGELESSSNHNSSAARMSAARATPQGTHCATSTTASHALCWPALQARQVAFQATMHAFMESEPIGGPRGDDSGNVAVAAASTEGGAPPSPEASTPPAREGSGEGPPPPPSGADVVFLLAAVEATLAAKTTPPTKPSAAAPPSLSSSPPEKSSRTAADGTSPKSLSGRIPDQPLSSRSRCSTVDLWWRTPAVVSPSVQQQVHRQMKRWQGLASSDVSAAADASFCATFAEDLSCRLQGLLYGLSIAHLHGRAAGAQQRQMMDGPHSEAEVSAHLPFAGEWRGKQLTSLVCEVLLGPHVPLWSAAVWLCRASTGVCPPAPALPLSALECSDVSLPKGQQEEEAKEETSQKEAEVTAEGRAYQRQRTALHKDVLSLVLWRGVLLSTTTTHASSSRSSINHKSLLSPSPQDGYGVPMHIRPSSGCLECASCLAIFHAACVAPPQLDRSPTGMFGCYDAFLCHRCRLQVTSRAKDEGEETRPQGSWIGLGLAVTTEEEAIES